MKQQTEASTKPHPFGTWLAQAVAILMVTLFPVASVNGYYSIPTDRLLFVLLMAIVGGSFIMYRLITNLKNSLSGQSPIDGIALALQIEPQRLNTARFGLAACWLMTLSMAITSVLSGNFKEALFATEGRLNGLLFYLACTIIVTLIALYLQSASKVLYLFCLTASAVSLVASLEHLGYDPLGFRDGLNPKQAWMFLSTFGNINTLCSYFGIALCVSVVLAVLSNNIRSKLVYWACFMAVNIGLVLASSDLGYLALAVGFGATFWLWANGRCLMRDIYISFGCLAIAVVSARWVQALHKSSAIKLRGVSKLLCSDQLFLVWIIILIALIIHLAYSRRFGSGQQIITQHWRKLLFWTALIALIVLAIVALYYYSVVNKQAHLGALENLLRMNFYWGTNRGFIWYCSLIVFSQFSLVHKLFGTGLGSFSDSMFANKTVYRLMTTNSFNHYNAAHNELLDYLISVGLLGLIAYFAVVTVPFLGKTSKDHSTAHTAAKIAILAYVLQSLVGIAQPMVTPFLFVFVAIALSQQSPTSQTKQN